MTTETLKKSKELFPRRLTPSLFNSLTPLNEVIYDFWGQDFSDRLKDEFGIPAVNIAENEKEFEVEVAAPGYKREEISLEVDDHVLTISSEHQEENEEEDKKITRKEFSYSKFERSFKIPENVMEDDINAEFHDGLLTVHLPKMVKRKSQTPKKINVN